MKKNKQGKIMKKENKFMSWMRNEFSPKLTKLCQNTYIAAVQKSIMTLLPIIMLGSFVTVLSLLKEYIPVIPDISLLNQFTFGLMSVFIAFLIPTKFLEERHTEKLKNVAALTSVGTFLCLLLPRFTEEGEMAYILDTLGTGGMFCAVFTGLIVSKVFYEFSKHSFFSEDTVMPDIVVNMFDAMIPVAVCVLLGVICYNCNIDIYALSRAIFNPLVSIAQTIPGFVLVAFAEAFLYSFGFTWILFPLQWPIWMDGIAANAAAVASGAAPTNISLMETFNGLIDIGGVGATLALVLLMCFSKSKKLKTIGRMCALPGVLNINEPVVFGAPVAYNPILMIPFWLNAIVLPLVAGIAYKTGLVAIPSAVNQLWYFPTVIQAFINSGVAGAVLTIVLFALSLLIWFPFFKTYEADVVAQEEAKEHK
jgi:PTS system cellobiose-specific IIC component